MKKVHKSEMTVDDIQRNPFLRKLILKAAKARKEAITSDQKEKHT
jgi:hypothetical protein